MPIEGITRIRGGLCRSFADPFLVLPKMRGMKNIKIALTSAVLLAPVLLPAISEAKATWT